TVTSSAFVSSYEPVHVYVEAGTALAAAVPAQGKEYGGLVPQLPFSPTHLVAARRVSDSGSGPYDGVFTPASGFTTQEMPLAVGSPGVRRETRTRPQRSCRPRGWRRYRARCARRHSPTYRASADPDRARSARCGPGLARPARSR